LVDREHGPKGYRHAVLIRVLRDAIRALRAAGLPAVGLAYLFLVIILVILPEPGLLLFLGVAAQFVVTFALVRYLAARRGIPAKQDGPPLMGRNGQPLRIARRPGPVGAADLSARHALRSAGQLARPAMRLALLQLIGALSMVVIALSIGGDNLIPSDRPTQAQVLRVMAGLVPVAALLLAFVSLAPQRIAIEGDHRVILAVFASIRIARASYGTLFALSIVEPLLVLAEVATDDAPALQIAAIVVHPLVHLVVVAALNEVYAAGPALVLPTTKASRD